MSQAYLGIDVAKKKIDVALFENAKFRMKIYPNNQKGFELLLSWIDSRGIKDCHFCMEATGRYSHAVSLFLYERGLKVSVVNPAQISAFAKSHLTRSKNDLIDAKTIACFAKVIQPNLYQPPTEAEIILRERIGRLNDLKAMVQQEENRLELAHNVIRLVIEKNIQSLKKQIEVIEQAIMRSISSDDDLKRNQALLESIPGIGRQTASTVIAYVGNIGRFDSAKSLAAFTGLVPKQFQSGGSVYRRTRLSKAGHKELRRALYMPTLVAIRHNPVIQDFYERMLQNGKCKMVAVGACMRKMIHIIYGVLQNQTPFVAHGKNEIIA